MATPRGLCTANVAGQRERILPHRHAEQAAKLRFRYLVVHAPHRDERTIPVVVPLNSRSETSLSVPAPDSER